MFYWVSLSLSTTNNSSTFCPSPPCHHTIKNVVVGKLSHPALAVGNFNNTHHKEVILMIWNWSWPKSEVDLSPPRRTLAPLPSGAPLLIHPRHSFCRTSLPTLTTTMPLPLPSPFHSHPHPTPPYPAPLPSLSFTLFSHPHHTLT